LHYARDTGNDIWSLGLEEGAQPEEFLVTPFSEWGARFAPRGDWVALVSDESGRWEIYLAPVDAPGARRPVSLDGGSSPHWRQDGKELFFLGPASTVMAAPVSWEGGEPRVGQPRALFACDREIHDAEWDVSPDGMRFLLNCVREDLSASPIRVLANWKGLVEE
jgi:hypothetical protein